MASLVSIIGLPVLSFVLLLFLGKYFSKTLTRIVGIAGIIMSCALTVSLWKTVSLPHHEMLWRFLPAGLIFDAPLEFGLLADSLSLTMALIVTFVSSLIAIYSSEYMSKDTGFVRFFAGINLFVAFMLLLVLADNLWLLFIGWEGVGLASYLLIGFYFRENKAVAAAMKAFLTTRVGDVFLLFGLFLSAISFGTLDIETMQGLVETYPRESISITLICLCLLGGAAGKSAQLPLQTWLADAMWGPTPVSALIHAATMVTAGVYLLVRMSFLVMLSPMAQIVIMIIGLVTLVMAGLAALVQTDMKRVLAYSTMSQVGYMFLAVGALAFQAAIFHLVTHAFFKALLFLSAGIIGHALHSYDLHAMGGLRKKMPAVFWFFMIGSASLMGLPFLGAGFFSKEWILNDVATSGELGNYFFMGAVFGTFLTALYTVRMLALAFFGEQKKAVYHHASMSMYGSVFVLALFSFLVGWLETPHFVADIHYVSNFLSSSVPKHENISGDLLWLLPTLASLLGALIALALARSQKTFSPILAKALREGFLFDALYRKLLVEPYQYLSHRLKSDVIKNFYEHFVTGLEGFFAEVAAMHTGRLSHYLSFMLVAVVTLASIMVLS